MLRLICGIVLVTFAMADTLLQQGKRAECKDTLGGNCPSLKHFCSYNNIAQICPATCGKCKETQVVVPTAGIGACPANGGDTSIGCSQWKKKGYCAPGSPYYNFVKGKCPASCGLCIAAPTQAPVAMTVAVPPLGCAGSHNDKRHRHIDTPDLTWDNNLAQASQQWALKLVELNLNRNGRLKLEHSSGSYGENLYAGTGFGMKTCADAVQAWYDEIKDYDWSKPIFSMATGHFTQVVWKGTLKVGCGIAKIKRGSSTATFVVCRYSPPGNYKNQFVQNVKALRP